MKKLKEFNKNSIVFALFFVFVIWGIWGKCVEQLKWSFLDLGSSLFHGNIEGISSFKEGVDNVSNSALSYHDALLNVNSVRENLLGTRVVLKGDDKVVKSNTGSLMDEKEKVDRSDICAIVDRIATLKELSEDNKAKFLYCAAPRKELYEIAPVNVNNYFRINYEYFLSMMKSADVPLLDFSEMDSKYHVKKEAIFYKTDHHWKSEAAFIATQMLCQELNKQYGLSINSEYLDLKNYNIKTYPSWFLGSRGKKVGTFFTWSGADDFDLITPNFETNLVEEQPFKNEIRKGTFTETLLFTENLKKDYYNINTYVTYSGGDYRLQIMKNNLNPNGKKALLIRDSFACSVAPFLSLQFSELHLCDMRNYESFVGKKINVKDYIQTFKPDYVLVLYSGITSLENSEGRFDFF